MEFVLEPIFPPFAMPLDQLKECYYRDLRMTLVPPPFIPDILVAAAADFGLESKYSLSELI